MLDFDKPTSSWIYDGVAIGPGSRVETLSSQLDVPATEVRGQSASRWIERRTPGLSLFAGFRDGLLHAGYFWDRDVQAGGWDEAERAENERRVKHEAVMMRIFGALEYEDARIHIYLRRDTREYLEELYFEIKGFA